MPLPPPLITWQHLTPATIRMTSSVPMTTTTWKQSYRIFVPLVSDRKDCHSHHPSPRHAAMSFPLCSLLYISSPRDTADAKHGACRLCQSQAVPDILIRSPGPCAPSNMSASMLHPPGVNPSTVDGTLSYNTADISGGTSVTVLPLSGDSWFT